MKPAWDKLMAAYKDSSTVLIADVDCTAEGKSKCDEVGVRGFPTIKYGDPGDLQDYNGGRDFEELKKFADGLGPLCSPANIDLCDDAKKKQIQEFTELGAEKRAEIIAEKDAEVEKLEADFKAFEEDLQKRYNEANEKKDAAKDDLSNKAFLGLLKAVHAFAKAEHASFSCDIETTDGCTDQQKKFIGKWKDESLDGIKKQLNYLQTASTPTKAKGKRWQEWRTDFFKQLAKKAGEEL